MTVRLKQGLTQEELAFRVGAINQGYVSELEHGKVNVTLSLIDDIASALKVSTNELFVFHDAPQEYLKGNRIDKFIRINLNK